MEFARNSADLTLELFSKLAEANQGKNLIFSPLSVQCCVALVHAGAHGDTSLEISKGLRFVSDEKAEVAESFGNVLGAYNGSDLVKIANKIYVQTGCAFKDEYNQLVTNKFHSEAEEINFSENENAASEINQWVAKKTNDKIQNLVSPQHFSDLTRLVLLNAIHFKGDWEKKFDETRTIEDNFWINQKHSVKVQMMNKKDKFQYGNFNDLNCSVLELPYKNSDLSMLIFLPNERDGLKRLAAQLKSANLIEMTERMFEEEIVVKFPKFKVEFSCELNEPLKQMGVQKMFGSDAEFDNLLKVPLPLFVSKVLHKACIEVNEEGTEAAAATAVIMMMRCAMMPLMFKADHPFLYIIWDKKSILFAGSFVTAPEAE